MDAMLPLLFLIPPLFILIFVVPWVFGIITIFKSFASRHNNSAQSVTAINTDQTSAISITNFKVPAKVGSSRLASEPSQKPSINEEFKNLNNINIFLYIGSFLVIIAAAVFIGVNYSNLTGEFKTWFFGAFALLFYLLGLLFYLKFPKIKPAGLTFATIGLVLAPLVGLTYYKFVANGQNGFEIWFTTSAVVFVLYFISLKVIKKPFIAYFLNFVSLSLFESFISLFNVPMYYFGWGMSLASMVFLLLSREVADEDVKKSFYLSAGIFLPASLILSLFSISPFGVDQLGINLMLASAFYFMATIYEKAKITLSSVYFMIALLILPIGLLIWLGDKNLAASLNLTIFAILAGLYVVIFEFIKKAWPDERPKISLIIAGVLAAIMALTFQDKTLVIIALCYSLALNFYALYRGKMSFNFAMAMFSILYLPQVIIQIFNNNSLIENQIYTYAYLLVALIIIVLRSVIVKYMANLRYFAIISYTIALIISLVYCSSVSDNSFVMMIMTAFAIIVGYLSYLENQDWVMAVGSVFVYLAAIQLVPILQLKDIGYTTILALVGSILFIFSLAGNKGKAKVLAYSGLAGVFAGAIYGSLSQHEIIPILVLLLAGVLLFIQARKEKSDSVAYVAFGIMVLSLLWWLNYINITELQVFTLIIAFYFGIISYLRYKKNDQGGKDTLAIFSLISLTVPLFLQACSGDNGILRSIILAAEGLALVFIGISIKYQLIRQWGIWTIVGAVLYLTIIALTKFAIWAVIGVVGLALLILAIFLLNKGHNQEPTP